MTKHEELLLPWQVSVRCSFIRKDSAFCLLWRSFAELRVGADGRPLLLPRSPPQRQVISLIDTAEIRIWRHFRWSAFDAVKIEMKFHFECKLHFPSARLMLSQMHWTSVSESKSSNDEPLLAPAHGEILEVTNTKYRGRARFRCTTKGYEINGSSQRICQANGRWDGEQTTCERKALSVTKMRLSTVMNTRTIILFTTCTDIRKVGSS